MAVKDGKSSDGVGPAGPAPIITNDTVAFIIEELGRRQDQLINERMAAMAVKTQELTKTELAAIAQRVDQQIQGINAQMQAAAKSVSGAALVKAESGQDGQQPGVAVGLDPRDPMAKLAILAQAFAPILQPVLEKMIRPADPMQGLISQLSTFSNLFDAVDRMRGRVDPARLVSGYNTVYNEGLKAARRNGGIDELPPATVGAPINPADPPLGPASAKLSGPSRDSSKQ